MINNINSEKYGLLTYSTTFNGRLNIGDFIQTLAAKQFLPKIDVLVDRENLSCYDGDSIKIIMNGWYMHNPNHWAPSSKINPLFVAFHLNSSVANLLLNNSGVEYLKKHEPVGCRDYYTVDQLKNKKIEAYYSSCLTLTLGEKYNKQNENSETIFIVDPYFPESSYKGLYNIFLSTIQALRIIKSFPKIKNIIEGKGIKAFIKAGAFYRIYKRMFSEDILKNAIYVTHFLEYTSEEDMLNLADSLLKQYSKAKFVISSRIHCVLPCLGIGIPSLYVHNQTNNVDSDCRLDGLLELLNVITLNNNGKFMSKDIQTKINRNSLIRNKTSYNVYKENLMKRCKNFIDNNIM
jgi:hypothetical protein